MAITNGYTTASDLKDRLQDSETIDDAVYEKNIETASRNIDHDCGRRFWKDTVDQTRTFVADDSTWLRIPDLVSLTSLKTDEDGDGTFERTWTTSDYELVRPDFPGLDQEDVPYTSIEAIDDLVFPVATYGRRRRVQIVGVFGWPSVPTDVAEACLIESARLFKRRSSPEGVLDFGQFGAIRVSRVGDADARRLIQPYERLTIGAV